MIVVLLIKNSKKKKYIKKISKNKLKFIKFQNNLHHFKKIIEMLLIISKCQNFKIS